MSNAFIKNFRLALLTLTFPSNEKLSYEMLFLKKMIRRVISIQNYQTKYNNYLHLNITLLDYCGLLTAQKINFPLRISSSNRMVLRAINDRFDEW